MYNCKLDEKISWMYKILKLPLSHVPYFLYPRIYRITDIGFVVRKTKFMNISNIGLRLRWVCWGVTIYVQT